MKAARRLSYDLAAVSGISNENIGKCPVDCFLATWDLICVLGYFEYRNGFYAF